MGGRKRGISKPFKPMIDKILKTHFQFKSHDNAGRVPEGADGDKLRPSLNISGNLVI